MKLFIHAHACMLSDKFYLGSRTILHFKVPEGSCAVNDSTQIDLDPDNYIYEVKQTSPTTKPNDYSVEFYDHLTTPFGLSTFGAFYLNQEENWVNFHSPDFLEESKDKKYLLSQMLEYYKENGFKEFYLNMCRTICTPLGGKKIKSSKKRRNKKINKRTTKHKL